VSLSRFNSYSGMHLSRQRNLGCKQNPGHPVNDFFDLGTDVRRQEKDVECVTVKGSSPVEKAPGKG